MKVQLSFKRMGNCFSCLKNCRIFGNVKRRNLNSRRIRKSEIFFTTKSGVFTNRLTVKCNDTFIPSVDTEIEEDENRPEEGLNPICKTSFENLEGIEVLMYI